MSKPNASRQKGRVIAVKSKYRKLSKIPNVKVSVKNMDARDMLIYTNRQNIDDARQIIRKNTVEKVGDLRGMLEPKSAAVKGGGDLRIALATRKNNSGGGRSHETPQLVYAEATPRLQMPNKPPYSRSKQGSTARPGSSRSAQGIPPLMQITNDTVQPTGIPAHMRRQPAPPQPRARSPLNRSRNPPQTRQTTQASRAPKPTSRRSPFSAVSLPDPPPRRRQSRYSAQQSQPIYSRSRSRSPMDRPYNGPVGHMPSPSRYSPPRRRSPSPLAWRPHLHSPPNYSRPAAANYGRSEPFVAVHGNQPASRMRMDQIAAERNMSSQRSMTENGHAADRAHRAPNTCDGYVLRVTSLSRDVTQDDVEELFGDVGRIIYAKLLSPGNAEVSFHSHSDALAAIDKYDRRELDGIPMDIRLITPASSSRHF